MYYCTHYEDAAVQATYDDLCRIPIRPCAEKNCWAVTSCADLLLIMFSFLLLSLGNSKLSGQLYKTSSWIGLGGKHLRVLL